MWHKVSEETPKMGVCEVLASRTVGNMSNIYEVVLWVKNLRKYGGSEEFDFPEYERGGFVAYDSDLMPHEVTIDAWQEIEPYDGN